jgi:hypothetical protein
MSESTDLIRARAERRFKAREAQKADAPKAIAEYYAAAQRLRDRTQELRRLRLAREAEKNGSH